MAKGPIARRELLRYGTFGLGAALLPLGLQPSLTGPVQAAGC